MGPLLLHGLSPRGRRGSHGSALLRLRPIGSQTQASLAIDRAIHARLIGESTTQQDRQRLSRLTAEHAGAWVTAVPSRIDGSDCIMSPAVFRTAVRYRLGVAVAHEGVVCSFCKQSFDIYGHHAGCCKKNANIIIRHNRIRNLVSRIGQEGLLSPVLEKEESSETPRSQDAGLGTSRSPAGRTPRAWQWMSASPLLSLAETYTRLPPPRIMVIANTGSMMAGSFTPLIGSVLLRWRPPAGEARERFLFYSSFCDSRPDSRAPSCVYTPGAPG